MCNKQTVLDAVDAVKEQFMQISLSIGNKPELGHEEFFASQLLSDTLQAHQFHIERNVLNISTAFIAVYNSNKPGPTIALLCEYDALPEIGHACGHHLICSMSAAAAVALKAAVDEFGGIIKVFGTPAEETMGSKVPMAEVGLFDDCDIALMAHPYYQFEKSGSSLALDAVQFEFFGKASHAAANPEEGINALDGVLQLFNSINALRQQTKSSTRIHGIIDHGGSAPNIIPDYASAKFYIRSETRSYTNELTEKVKRCAEGAAMQCGCKLSMNHYELSYDELVTNEPLSEQFIKNMIELGVEPEEIGEGQDHGSLDLGNVSAKCPAIHPYVKIVEERFLLHTTEFRDAAMTPKALERMIFGAKLLAATAYDVIASPELLHHIKTQFNKRG